MTVAVDSNVLLDLLIPRAPDALESTRQLRDESDLWGSLIISEAVYAELSGRFLTSEELAQFIRRMDISLIPTGRTALYTAGVRWREYTQRRPRGLQCPRCGTISHATCTSCGEPLTTRQHVVADFLIGAHAMEHADRLLTRDRGFYAAYFPELMLA